MDRHFICCSAIHRILYQSNSLFTRRQIVQPFKILASVHRLDRLWLWKSTHFTNHSKFTLFLVNLTGFTVDCLPFNGNDEPDCTESVKKPQFGQIRVWGTIGYGLFGFLSGPINSVNFGPSYLEMGFIMFIVILILDLTIVSVCARKWSILVMPSATGQTRIKGQNERKEEEEETNEKFISRKEQQETLNCQKNSQQHWSIFVSLFIHHPTLIQHTIILIGQGVLMACHWSYFYWFLELVSGRNTFLMGLTLLIGCFCGELIFFYYGNSIVNQIGSTNAFNISLAAFAVQYTIYAFLITPENQYLVCLTEVLQGPTFGLFYTAMTHIGQEYADKQAAILQSSKSESAANVTQIHATLQGFLSGCLEGLGLGLGSLGAGLLIDRYGVHIMWMIAASLAVFLLILNSSFQLIRAIMITYKS
uniref:Major facilitator superfamily associated domain-containing protein n=1 Tax=Tetranychus urticae TaxID=32264 RepID=T1KVE3_TETUR